MTPDQGVHVMPSAGDPQTEPGPQCQEWSRPLYDASTTTRNTLERWRQVVHPTGICAGCFGHHPKRLTARGWLIEPHTPSPPQYHWCPWCPEPLLEPSYTNAGHPWCGDNLGVDTEQGLGVE